MTALRGSLPPVFAAVDTPDLKVAEELVTKLQLQGLGIKLGLEFFSAHGGAGVRSVAAKAPGVPIFLDLKFHDIPNTVAGAIWAVAPLNVAIVNVHAGGGPAMMKAAVAASSEAAAKHSIVRPLVIAVTVLTSLDNADLEAVGQTPPAENQVVRLAKLAQQCGMDGVVCSSHEISSIRVACGDEFVLVVPGIRPGGAALGDQKRVRDALTSDMHASQPTRRSDTGDDAGRRNEGGRDEPRRGPADHTGGRPTRCGRGHCHRGYRCQDCGLSINRSCGHHEVRIEGEEMCRNGHFYPTIKTSQSGRGGGGVKAPTYGSRH